MSYEYIVVSRTDSLDVDRSDLERGAECDIQTDRREPRPGEQRAQSMSFCVSVRIGRLTCRWCTSQ